MLLLLLLHRWKRITTCQWRSCGPTFGVMLCCLCMAAFMLVCLLALPCGWLSWVAVHGCVRRHGRSMQASHQPLAVPRSRQPRDTAHGALPLSLQRFSLLIRGRSHLRQN
jgi:hypothetical protein